MISVQCNEDSLSFPVRVTPRGGKDCVLTFDAADTSVKLKVSVPPEGGKANAAVIQLLAAGLGLAKSRIRITSGEKSRQKRVAIALQSSAETLPLLKKLAQLIGSDITSCLTY